MIDMIETSPLLKVHPLSWNNILVLFILLLHQFESAAKPEIKPKSQSKGEHVSPFVSPF